MVFLAASFDLALSLSVWYLAIWDELVCNLIWCYVDKLVYLEWIVGQVPGQLPSFLDIVHHSSVLKYE